ncbi:hypothetical protein [Actinomadura parmotrematis]|uniref:Uncharacterized protein n=1 Tax=Actinomadura parmotrematis TaxID=2864039 RepID=A0ABS7FVC3_9ACTN|nr:hypothetical protein [Actinomadura parmotrematis]MBW8484369.1 hypothetical protein [Actinomadura parmotrematis]
MEAEAERERPDYFGFSCFLPAYEAMGKSEAIFRMLEKRKIRISESARAKIHECRDHDQLDAWFRYTTSYASPEDVIRGLRGEIYELGSATARGPCL